MTSVVGLGDCELERVVQRLQTGGLAKIIDDYGCEVTVRIEKFDPSHAVDPYTTV